MVLELPVLIKELARGKLNTQIMVLHCLFLQLQFKNLPGDNFIAQIPRNLASTATSVATTVEVKSHCFLPTPPTPSLAVFPSATASGGGATAPPQSAAEPPD
jgi:hypothetical protein